MHRFRALTHHFTATNGSSGEETVYSVREGETFTSDRLRLETNATASNGTDVRLKNGEAPVAPHNGNLTVNDDSVHLAAGELYDTGDDITLSWAATSNGGDTDVTVIVEGELER